MEKITRKDVREFLDNLQWQRMTKECLEEELQDFFSSNNELIYPDEESEYDDDCDYHLDYTSQSDSASHNLVDVEIYYLPTRNDEIIITGTELLMFLD